MHKIPLARENEATQNEFEFSKGSDGNQTNWHGITFVEF